MDDLSPELVHIICSFLSIDDVLNFRLVGKAFADIGAAYMLPEVRFYTHERELDRLRAISLHPIVSRNVRTLTYVGDLLDYPKVCHCQFIRQYYRERAYYRITGRDPHHELSESELLEEYSKYAIEAEKQQNILNKQLDVSCMKDVIPRFTGLKVMMMSCGNEFHSGRFLRRRHTPFDDLLRQPGLSDGLEGKRHLEHLLLAVAEAPKPFRTLRAGSLDWTFFKRGPEDLSRLFQPLEHIQSIEFVVYFDAAWKFRDMMSRGAVRTALKSLKNLQSLNARFHNSADDDPEAGTPLADVIQPGYRWPQLQNFALGGIDCDREDLMNVLELHKDTMKRLCLQDFTLKKTSWRKLLPDIRNKLYLHDACICGDLYGIPEDEDEFDMDDPHGLLLHLLDRNWENWNLSTDDIEDNDMRDSINAYCRLGGKVYPDELPLSRDVVSKHYTKHVKGLFPRRPEDQNSIRIAYAALRDQFGLGLFSDDEWGDFDSNEDDDDDDEDSEHNISIDGVEDSEDSEDSLDEDDEESLDMEEDDDVSLDSDMDSVD